MKKTLEGKVLLMMKRKRMGDICKTFHFFCFRYCVVISTIPERKKARGQLMEHRALELWLSTLTSRSFKNSKKELLALINGKRAGVNILQKVGNSTGPLLLEVHESYRECIQLFRPSLAFLNIIMSFRLH